MNTKFFTVYLAALFFCFQPVFGYWSVLFSTVTNGYKAYDYIKKHLPGDENKALQPISVTHTGGKCSQIIQKLKGKEIYVNYHIDHDPVYDIVYAAGNNGHTYGKMIKTLTDKMNAQGKSSWHFQVAGINSKIVNKNFGCPGSPQKWMGKAAEYDYHVVVTENHHCSKNWGALKAESDKIKKEVDDYNNRNNAC